MPQTDPFTYLAPRKMSAGELARALRLDAAAELDAMNLYEAHIEATDDEDARKVLSFIVKDEKEHYALFVELIRRLDPTQAEELASAAPKLDAILAATPGGASEEAVERAGEAEPAGGSLDARLEAREALRRPTVGSLLGQPQAGGP